MLGLTSEIKVKVVEEKGCLHTYSVELSQSKVKETIETAFKHVQGQAKLPGFRPGKAPLEMVRSNFQGAAYEKAQDLLMRDGVMEALKAKKINPAQTPVIKTASEFFPDKNFQFEFFVEVIPTVKPVNYKGLKLSKKSAAVTDADVQKALDRLLEANARLVESTEQVLAATHFAVIDYAGFLDGKPIEGAKSENFLLDMSAPQSISGLAEGLAGCKIGEEREVKVTFPADSPSKDLAGKEANFKVKLQAIKQKKSPALDDEFAKDLGLESLAVLRSKVKENLEREQKQIAQADLEKQVIDQLLEAHAFDVPESFRDKQVQVLTQRQSNRLMQQGFGPDDLKKVLDQNKGEMQKQAEKDVRLAYILNAIAAAESIEATEAELDGRIKEILDRAPEKERAKLEKSLRNQYKEQIQSELREAKLFDWLISNAKIKES